MPQRYSGFYAGPHPGAVALGAGVNTAEKLANFYLKYRQLEDERARREDERGLRSREIDANEAFRRDQGAHLLAQGKYMESQTKNMEAQRQTEQIKALVAAGADPKAI